MPGYLANRTAFAKVSIGGCEESHWGFAGGPSKGLKVSVEVIAKVYVEVPEVFVEVLVKAFGRGFSEDFPGVYIEALPEV